MALINTLREKGSKLIIGFIAIAIASFVLTDLLSGKNSILAGNSRDVGEIAGEKISYNQFQQMVDVLASNYTNNFGKNPNADQLIALRNQAWFLLITEKAFSKEYTDLDISVSSQELIDMVQGKNISSDLKQIFTDRSTGQFSKQQLLQTLNKLNTTPQGRAKWKQFEEDLIVSRKKTKLENLLMKSTFVTDTEAERAYKDQKTIAEIKYLHVPFYTINDSSVNVSDAELSSYISNNKDQYKVDWSKSIEFISIPITPSADDSLAYREELIEMKEEFTTISEDSLYAASNSDTNDFFDTYTKNKLPSLISSKLKTIKRGTITGPYVDGNRYVLYKMSDIFEDTAGIARASHILIKWENDSKKEKEKAKKTAQTILKQVLKKNNFAEIAKEKSADARSSVNGGDLGWFETGKMVKSFDKAVFSATKKGIIPRIVKSSLGFHIINVTELASYTKYKIATVGIEITPSDKTRDKAFRKADFFAGTSSNYNDFKANAKKEEYPILEASNIKPNDEFITQIGKARQLVTWLFRDATKGKVSAVNELDNQYVIAVMTDEQEEGLSNVDIVRLEVTTKVKNKKKAEIIIEKLKKLTGSLDEIAKNYGADANVYAAANLKFSSNSIANVGTAPEAIGIAFSLKKDSVSEPISTDSGVIVIQLENITPAVDIADYSLYSNNLLKERENKAPYYLGELVKKEAKIKDQRYKFY